MNENIEVAIAELRNAGYAVKIWSPEDIESALAERDDFEDFSAQEIEDIVNDVLSSDEWSLLEDPTEQDWILINDAIEGVLGSE